MSAVCPPEDSAVCSVRAAVSSLRTATNLLNDHRHIVGGRLSPDNNDKERLTRCLSLIDAATATVKAELRATEAL